MKACFILNPHSGRNRARPWLAPHIKRFIVEQRLDASLVVTTAPGHATALARAALSQGCDRVIAVGGDGTMNEVAQALVDTRAALGLVPCGSGNGLALHLGLPTVLDSALRLAAAPGAQVGAIDTATANGHRFFNAMGCGFDADVSQRFNQLKRRGLIAYARTGCAAFRERQLQPAVIRAGGRNHNVDSLLIAVSNSDQYGNHARIAPGARVDDAELDLTAIFPVSVLSALPLIARLFSGRLHTSPRVLHLRSARIVIERLKPGLIHTDGETHVTAASIEVKVRPRSLHMVVPSNSALRACRLVGEPAAVLRPNACTDSREAPVPAFSGAVAAALASWSNLKGSG